MLVLPQRTIAASIITLRGTRQQRACFETILKKKVFACRLPSEKRRATSGLGGLQSSFIWMGHTMKSSGCGVPELDFCWLESSVCRNVYLMTLILSPPDRSLESFMNATAEEEVFFCASRIPALCFSWCHKKARIGKYASKGARPNSYMLFICWTWPSATPRGRQGRKIPFSLSCLLFFVSCVLWGCLFACEQSFFPHPLQCHLFIRIGRWWC